MSGRANAPVVAIVQARMSSSRLPGKVLKDLGPGTTLELLAHRLSGITQASAVVIATSDDPSDDELVEAIRALGLRVSRGPLDDVLERYRLAASELPCEAVIRITSDCPLVVPEVVDRLVEAWRDDERLDYVWNTQEPRTFPDGLDTEVVSRTALEAAAAETDVAYDREHVTPFVRDRPERFPQRGLRLEPPARGVKLSLDTPQDLATIQAFVARVGPDPDLGAILMAAGGDPAARVVG